MADARTTLILIGVGLLACGGYLAGELAVGGPGFPLDDTWIHLQFARNLAAGEGLSYRDGVLVSGSTAPLWTALLSLLFVFPGGGELGVVLGAKLLSAACYLVAAPVLFSLGRELGLRRSLCLVAALLFLLTDWMVWAALSGMEIPLFVLLSLYGMLRHARESAAGSAVAVPVLAVATLVRPEGFLLLVLALLERLVPLEERGGRLRRAQPAWRPLLLGLALAATLLLPVAILYLAIAGSPFPTTLAVKAGGSDLPLPSLRHLHVVMGILFRPQPWAFLGAFAGVLVLFERSGSRKDRGVLPALWLLLLPLGYSILSGADRPLVAGNFGRYFFPLFAPMILLGALGVERLTTRLRHLEPPLGRLALVAALLVVFLPSLRAAVVGGERFALNVRNVAQSDVAAARWIRDHVPAQARLAVQDIGAIGYLVPNPIVDLAGIVNPEILPYIKGDRVGPHPTRLGGLAEFVRQAKVDVLVLFPSSYGGIESLQSVLPGLRPIHALPVERNITMAGDELVILETPW